MFPPSPYQRPPSPHLRQFCPCRLPFRPLSAPAPAQQGVKREWRVGGVGVGFEGGVVKAQQMSGLPPCHCYVARAEVSQNLDYVFVGWGKVDRGLGYGGRLALRQPCFPRRPSNSHAGQWCRSEAATETLHGSGDYPSAVRGIQASPVAYK